MKKLYRLFLLAILFSGMHQAVFAGWIGLNATEPKKAEINLLESNIQKTQIQFNLDGFYQNDTRTPKGTEAIIFLENGVQITEKGMPDLPKLYANIIIPDANATRVEILEAKYQEFQNISIAPSKGHFTRDINPDDVPFMYGMAYEKNEFWPSKIAQLEDPFILRDFRGQTVTIFPVQYNPITKILRVYTSITVEISTIDEPGKEELTRLNSNIIPEREFMGIYKRFFINSHAADKNYQLLEGEEGSLLIIAHDGFMEAMQPFVDWKRQTGRKTVMVSKTEAGATAVAIKAFVQNYYTENPDFAHLLLVGDAPQIPPINAPGGHSDNSYGFLSGNDNYNELFVGRFSAETVAQVETQVARMIYYEKNINETDTWLSRAMGIARNEGAGNGHNGGEADYVHINYILDTLENFTYSEVLQRYDGSVPGIPNTTSTIISADLNQGVGSISFCNHGSETGWSVANYSITHVNQLTNTNMLPFIFSVACVNGAFVNTFCFAESWLRATHEGEATGAIGTMMSTINQAWQPPMTGQDEMVALLTEQSIAGKETLLRTFGGIGSNGSMAMIPAHGSSGIETHQTWVLFGDPTLKVRTAAPVAMNPTYNPVVFIGAPSMDITLPDAEGAFVSVTRYDETLMERVIVGTAIVTDGMANITFNEPITEPGMFALTITGFNKITYIDEELQVIPPDGPYVIFDALTIDDTEGNNNGRADYTETISLNVSLKNVGIEKADNVQAILTTDNEYITLLNTEQIWGEIAEESNLLIETAFSFKVDTLIPDNHSVLFSLTISGEDTLGAQKNWDSKFILKLFSPVLVISELVVDDSEANDNGLFEPGETANLLVNYTNNGGAPAMAPVAELHLESPYFSIDQNTYHPEPIPSGESLELSYTLHAHEAIIKGTPFNLLFSVEDAQRVESEQILMIGQTPEMQMGDANNPSNQYPFYNYYKANRSQMIYTAEELGAGEKTILQIGFNIIQVATEHNNLPNFFIRIKHVEQTSLSSFLNTSEAQVVFHDSIYQMPSETGWHLWDIEPFVYDGTSNLLIEITWGLLPQWANTYYKVASTQTGLNQTAYGYSDTQALPSYNGATNMRPNLYLGLQAEEILPSQVVEFTVKNQLEELLTDAELSIGSMQMNADEVGNAHLTLQPGNYSVSVQATGHLGADDVLFEVTVPEGEGEDDGLKDEGQNDDPVEPTNFVEIILTRLFNTYFTITDFYGNTVDDAVIALNETGYEAGVYNFELMMPGTYQYTITRQEYFDLEGSFDLLTSDAMMEVMLMPDGTIVNELTGNKTLIYPNPFSSQISIRSEGQDSNVEIEIIDIIGNVVYKGHSKAQETFTIDLSHLRTGNYFVKIISTKKTEVLKITKAE